MTDLPVHTSPRGFDFHAQVPSEYGGHITVSESSAADGPHVWVRTQCPVDLDAPDGPTVQTALHLTADNAWQLARQLAATVVRHYQGDARPETHEQAVQQALTEVLGAETDDEVTWTLGRLEARDVVLIHIGTEEPS